VRVLLVDDAAADANALAELLREERADIHVATSPLEAVRLAGSHDFDVIVSDIAMPDMNGHEMLLAIRSEKRNRNVPAIALTGFGRHHDLAQPENVSFAQYLTKPTDLEGLVSTIKSLVTPSA
jgi:two-component system CheB/CheR fusion protein